MSSKSRVSVFISTAAFIAGLAAVMLLMAAAAPDVAAGLADAAPGSAPAPPGAPDLHDPGSPYATEPAHGEESVWVFLARIANFAILAGAIILLLRSPLTQYLKDRSAQIRGDLVNAVETRKTAAAQLGEIERRLQALPGELEALRARGAQEIAAEEARITRAAEAERERLLQQARREIDLQLRVARRDLLQHAAALAVSLAAERIRHSITDDDQRRLVDQYLDQVGHARM
jgi:F-type H+-transporting ATPase subunit b